jgi:hypothetical protein
MDKDVLIRFIQFLETTFARINSKRLMTLYAYLLFLLYSKEMTDSAVLYGTLVTILVLLLFMMRGKDSVVEAK